MDRLARKFETARRFVPRPEIDRVADAKIGFIGYGTSHWAIGESRDQLREESDVEDVLLPAARAIRSTRSWRRSSTRTSASTSIEQNRDAQLLQLMKLELTPEQQTKLRSVLHYNGLPIDARSITDDVLAQEGFEVAKKTVRASARASAGGE